MTLLSHTANLDVTWYYGIADPYFRFWLEFVSPEIRQAQIELRQWKKLTEETRAALPQFLGRTLETWYRKKIAESGEWDQVGSWWDRRGGGEIDVVAFNRAEKRLLVGECKLNIKKFDRAKLSAKAGAFLLANPSLSDFSLEIRGLSLEGMLEGLL